MYHKALSRGLARRFTICMASTSLQARKMPESFLTVVPNGLVRHPDLHPLQDHMELVRFEWEHFPITMRRLLPHEDKGTMSFGSVWLAIAEIIISWGSSSQHFLLEGTKLGCRVYVMQMHISMCKGINKPLSTLFINQTINDSTIIKKLNIKHHKKINHKMRQNKWQIQMNVHAYLL